MKALLDTHIFLWWITDAPQLPAFIRDVIANGENELFLSAASCWEIAIKARLGKISLPAKPDQFISEQMATILAGAPVVLSSHSVSGLPFILAIAFNVPFSKGTCQEITRLLNSDIFLFPRDRPFRKSSASGQEEYTDTSRYFPS